MKKYKYIIAFVLAFMALPIMAQDYMSIFFKNGDFRKFYMKNITGITTSKVDAEGIKHEDYSYQHITTIYDKYIYSLEDIDSITFTKVDEEKAEHNFVTAMPEVFSALEDCETIADVENKIDDIKNAEGVADAWSDGHELHVSIAEGETFSFHFNHDISDQEDNIGNDLVAQIRAMKSQFVNMLKDDGTPLKVLLTDQESKDESRNHIQNFNYLKQELSKCGIIVDYREDPTVDFFYNNTDDPDNPNFYDYDIVLLITHGSYGPIAYNRPEKEKKKDGEIIAKKAEGVKGHSFFTSEEIGEPIDKHKNSSWAKKYKTFKEWRDKKQYGDVTDVHISFSFVEEERAGKKVYVAYPKLTEYFFRDIAKGHFKNTNSIFHNAACQSLKGDSPDNPSESFANILFNNRGLGAYSGYTDTNLSGQRGGCELLLNMALGYSVKKSYDKLPAWCKLESLENFVNNANVFVDPEDHKMDTPEKVIKYFRKNPPCNAELKLLYSNHTTVSDSFFLFPVITVSKDNKQANEEYVDKGQVTISGLTTFASIEDGISTGFYYSTNEFRLDQKIKAEKEVISDSEDGNCLFKAQLTNLEPGKTYYYHAYTSDGVNYNWGEKKSFTIPKSDNLIKFKDQLVKEICVKNWDKDGDGELSYDEAASVTSIETVFYRQKITSFNELQFFTGLKKIYRIAFFECSSLTSITIPDGVTYIGDSAFEGCSSLIFIKIPDGVSHIGEYAFKGCSSLTSFTIPNSVTDIPWGVFMNCSGLTSVTIPNGVTRIQNRVFWKCSSLTSITIPEGVTRILTEVFSGCSSLTSITLPSSLTNIGSWAFSGCSSIKDVFCMATKIPDRGDNIFSKTPIENATLHVQKNLVEKYKKESPWNEFKEIVAIE